MAPPEPHDTFGPSVAAAALAAAALTTLAAAPSSTLAATTAAVSTPASPTAATAAISIPTTAAHTTRDEKRTHTKAKREDTISNFGGHLSNFGPAQV